MLINKGENLPDTQQQKKPPYDWKRQPGSWNKTPCPYHIGHMSCVVISANCDDRRCEGNFRDVGLIYLYIFQYSILLKIERAIAERR